MPAEDLVQNNARPLAGTGLTEKLDMIFFFDFAAFQWYSDTYTDQWCHPKWALEYHEISLHFKSQYILVLIYI